jgi:glycosyltransferase involved in cell wall biosynthesis
MKKLHLMQITHDLDYGGLQQVVVNLCKTIDKNRFDVSILCLRNLGAFLPEVEKMGIKVFLLPQKLNGTDYFSFLKVAGILRKEKVDIIHTHNTQPFIDGTIGALLSGVKTIVHTDHARDFPDKRRYMFAEWLMSHFVYKVVGVSEHTSNNLIRYDRISPQKVITIPNGIDLSRFSIELDKAKKKMELGIQKRDPIIGLGVRLAEQKGITYLLKAMPEIIRHFPNITLLIAGEGPLEGKLKEEVLALGIDKNVRFIGPRLDIPEVLKVLNLYVLSSLWEGLPMVVLEAMAAKCPIVATNVGGTHRVITHRKNGSLVEPKNPEALSSEIIRVLSDKPLRSSYIQQSLKILKKKFTVEIMTNQYQKLYLKEL